jgi:hypothetical protein
MATAITEDPRKFRGKSPADRILMYLVSTYDGRHGVKRLAADAEVSARTAENWLQGLNRPGTEPLLRLMVAHPDLQDQINDDIALLRRAHASQQTARTLLHETTSRDRPAARRAGTAVGLGLDQQPGHAAADRGVANEGV